MTTFKVFHFHGDHFDLPPKCVSLAFSEHTGCQVFRHARAVYGFQYHIEMDAQLLVGMCHNEADYLKANGYDAEKVIESGGHFLSDVMKRDGVVLGRWLDILKASVQL